MTAAKRFRLGYFDDEHAILFECVDGELVSFKDYENLCFTASAPKGEPAKPVAWHRNHPWNGWTDCRLEEVDYYRAKGQEVRPLYTSPPPAAGWDEAIEAAVLICREAANEADGNASREVMAEELAASLAALTASAPKGEPCADWSDLPKDIYVIGAQRVNAVGYDVQCCSVPMVAVPEVRYVRADMVTALYPASSDSHDSDCATHNEPAYPNGPCNCSAAGGDQAKKSVEASQ